MKDLPNYQIIEDSTGEVVSEVTAHSQSQALWKYAWDLEGRKPSDSCMYKVLFNYSARCFRFGGRL